MRRETTQLFTKVTYGALYGASGLQEPISAESVNESTVTGTGIKLSVSRTGITAGRYLISFTCQHKSNNRARHKSSRVSFCISGEEVAFDLNPTKNWRSFGKTYFLDLEEGDQTFSIQHRAEGGFGASVIRGASVSVVLQTIA